jgi:hypothetical protein
VSAPLLPSTQHLSPATPPTQPPTQTTIHTHTCPPCADVEYTLARSRYKFDDLEAYMATAYSVRDRLIESWNDTQTYMKTQVQMCTYGLVLWVWVH